MSGWPPERSRHGGVDEVPLSQSHGRLWLCGKHFVGPDPEEALRRVGATTVVCLTEAHELAGRYDSYLQWLRQSGPARAVWFPIPDLHVPDPQAIVPFIADLRACYRQKSATSAPSVEMEPLRR